MTFFIAEPRDASDRVIRAGGELDMAVAPQLDSRLRSLIDEGERQLVLDLTEATFIDSTMIGALVSALKRVRGRGGSVEIVCTAPNVRRTFEFAGLEREFRFHDSLEEVVGGTGEFAAR